MTKTNCAILGILCEDGTDRRGCRMGPDAFRAAGLDSALQQLGHTLADLGNLERPAERQQPSTNDAVKKLGLVHDWIGSIQIAALKAAQLSDVPIFLGGDHVISTGTIPAMSVVAEERSQPLFVLWLDAHPDMHTLASTQSGNLHGTPVAYVTGQSGFDGYPPLTAPVPEENFCMIGLRSVDAKERDYIETSRITAIDMRMIDEVGIRSPLLEFLERVRAANGRLHVSLDVDFLTPEIAPAVGTTVPGGATFREAHLIMETLHESGLVSSLDLVELNPFLDVRGQTAHLMVDLCASLFGKKIFDRRTTV